MKLYVVYCYSHLEGCNPPESVWSTRELAEKTHVLGGTRQIEELELDKPSDHDEEYARENPEEELAAEDIYPPEDDS